MGSRDDDQKTRHPPLLSSLVVRPSRSDSAAGEGVSGGRRNYEPGEFRHDPPPSYPRSSRYSDDHGYRLGAGSVSPGRRRNTERRNSRDFDNPQRGRNLVSRREPVRHRDSSPPYGRGRKEGGRGFGRGRGFDRPGVGPGGDGVSRNNPNVRPREGDWYCLDPVCNNLNFARRDSCNNCHKPRHGHRGSNPPPYAASRRPPPLDRSPVRPLRSSPPRPWALDGPPRNFIHEGRFSDNYMRRDHRTEYVEDGFRGRDKFDERPLATDHHRGRENNRWWSVRERSRSPIGGSFPPHRDLYLERGRDDRRGGGRERIGSGAY